MSNNAQNCQTPQFARQKEAFNRKNKHPERFFKKRLQTFFFYDMISVDSYAQNEVSRNIQNSRNVTFM